MKKVELSTWRKIFSELPNLSVKITSHHTGGKNEEVVPMFFITSAGNGLPSKSAHLPIFEDFAGEKFGYQAVMVQHRTPYLLFYGEAIPLWDCLDAIYPFPNDLSPKYREDYISLLKNLASFGFPVAKHKYDEFIDNEEFAN